MLNLPGKIIVSCSPKGGTGKTTQAVNLAVMRALAGCSVLLVDSDTVAESASKWAAVRAEDPALPGVVCVQMRGRIGKDLLAMRSRFNTIIVDAAGGDSVEMRNALAICDRALVTIRPGQFDTWSLDHMAKLLQEIEERTGAKAPALALINAANANPRMTEVDEVREILQDYADVMPTLPGIVADRVSFRRAARGGMAACELSGKFADPEATAEMLAVYAAVFA